MARIGLGSAVLLALFLGACGGKDDAARDRAGDSVQLSAEDGLARLTAWMTGSFASTAQAARDTNFADIRLEMAPIWPDRSESVQTHWLYVEQAMVGYLDRPYRQRVYRVRALGEGRYESAVYTLPDPRRFVGAWKQPELLAPLTPDSLEVRTGCAIVMTIDRDGDFVGSTNGRDCISELSGASYATSTVRIDADGMDTLDQGFDDAGTQVWGSRHGPYEFRRVR